MATITALAAPGKYLTFALADEEYGLPVLKVREIIKMMEITQVPKVPPGAEYGRIGRPNNTGTRIVCVSGDVVRPGYFEIEVGALTMGQVINEMAGGPKPGRKIKAVIPGGSSAKVLRAGDLFKLKDLKFSSDAPGNGK